MRQPTHRESMAACLLAARWECEWDWGSALELVQDDPHGWPAAYLRMADAALGHIAYLHDNTGVPFALPNTVSLADRDG